MPVQDILADCALPNFSGGRALEMLRANDPDLPYIVVSGTIGEETAVDMMRAGASDYILKGSGLKRLGPAVLREITDAEHRRSRRRTERGWELADKALSNAAEAIFITDADFNVVTVNHAFSDITGFSSEEVLGKQLPAVANGVYHQSLVDEILDTLALPGRWQGEVSNLRKSGESYRELLSISAIRDELGEIMHLVGAANDITALKAYEDKLDFLAHYDGVTGLPNRITLEKHFAVQCERAKRDDRSVAVLFIDLDHFKSINDSLGHSCGDMVLKAVGQRFRDCLRDSDMVGRLAGDEFIVLASGLNKGEDAMMVATKLMESLKRPLQFAHREIFCLISIGIAVCPDHSRLFEELVNFADSAMYKAKKLGRNSIEFYCTELSVSSAHYFSVFHALHGAVENGEFVVHYQPAFNILTGEVRSVEALVRWERPDHGLVPPGIFISIAEQSGLIGKIGAWVLETACNQAAAWHRRGLFFGRMAVNVSARQFREPDIASRTLEILNHAGLAPENLELELTESTLMDNPEFSSAILGKLREAGISVAIDDFGTGYSSLTYLNTLPLDVLKIDRSFIDRLPGDAATAITRTILNMAEGLGLDVIAEGVETEIQRNILLQHGCSVAQGFLFCRPAPASEIEKLFIYQGQKDAG